MCERDTVCSKLKFEFDQCLNLVKEWTVPQRGDDIEEIE